MRKPWKRHCKTCNTEFMTSGTRSYWCPECSKERDAEAQKRVVEKQRETRASRKERGLCECCGKCPNDSKSTRCEDCILKSIAGKHLGSERRWKEIKDLFDTQNRLCPYLQKTIYVGSTASLDHKTSKSNGGTDDIENLEWIHININQMKWNMDKEEFICWLKEHHVKMPGLPQ